MEEILGRGSNAFWWSPDGTRLAFMRFDDAPVPIFPIYHADGQHGELERTRYPKAGDPNPYVRIGVVSVADGKTTWMDFEEKADHYLSFPKWAVDGRTLFVQWMNRGQDTLKLFACDPATGQATAIHQETQRSWVDWYDDLTPLADGSLLFISDVDGWRHLYRYAKGDAGGDAADAAAPGASTRSPASPTTPAWSTSWAAPARAGTRSCCA